MKKRVESLSIEMPRLVSYILHSNETSFSAAFVQHTVFGLKRNCAGSSSVLEVKLARGVVQCNIHCEKEIRIYSFRRLILLEG